MATDESAFAPERSKARQYVALVVITAATGQVLGLALRTPSELGANDISRWCTVWSLLEKGTYAIDDCPWQAQTQDKVRKTAPFQRRKQTGPPVEHFYSSKPPLLPTMIAGVLYPVRKLVGVPLDQVHEQQRQERYVDKPVEGSPGQTVRVLERPNEPAKWPVYVFYFKPMVILTNIVPMLISLILYARLLDRYALNDWAWFLSLVGAAWGTFLFAFDTTLNNHTIAAYSAFFAIYAFIRLWDEEARSPWLFAAAGFFAAFCACNELPAALFGLLIFGLLLIRFPGPTLRDFVPAAALPCVAFLITQFLALGQFRPVYEEFGTQAYNFKTSYWNAPLEMDWLNLHKEPYGIYLFHMTFGHHGVFSLTPLYLFSILGAVRLVIRRDRLTAVAWMTLLLTAAMLAFYTWNPKARNYGGSAQGLRWLIWLIPFWLVTLPDGIEPGGRRRWVRWLSLLALGVSTLSVGYALKTPWSHPWFLDMIEHLNLYPLPR